MWIYPCIYHWLAPFDRFDDNYLKHFARFFAVSSQVICGLVGRIDGCWLSISVRLFPKLHIHHLSIGVKLFSDSWLISHLKQLRCTDGYLNPLWYIPWARWLASAPLKLIMLCIFVHAHILFFTTDLTFSSTCIRPNVTPIAISEMPTKRGPRNQGGNMIIKS